jgi:hypothetical protein
MADRFKQKVAVAAVYPPKGKPRALPGLFFNGDEPIIAHHEQSYRVEPRCIPRGVAVVGLHRGMVRALANKELLEPCGLCFDWQQWPKVIGAPGRYRGPKKRAKKADPEPALTPAKNVRTRVVDREYGATTLGDWL